VRVESVRVDNRGLTMTVENTQGRKPLRSRWIEGRGSRPAPAPKVTGIPPPTLENAIAGIRLVLAMRLHPNEKLRRIHNLLNELDAALRAAGQSGA
jgi:hypothetical protein